MHAYEAIAEALHDLGVDVLFGLMGDANLRIVEHYVSLPGTTYVSAAHEAGAIAMAHGYALVSGRLGVATVTHGPAVTNTVTVLVEAVKNRTPLILLAGDTAASAPHHHQNIDQEAVVSPTGALFLPLTSADQAYDIVAEAARLARAQRLPVVLNVPHDLQDGAAERGAAPAPADTSRAGAGSEDALDAALGIIASSDRPLVLAGRGAIDARDTVLAFARRIGAPVATTLKAKDLFAGEPEALGIFGGLAEDQHIAAMSSADCVIAFGAGLNPWTTHRGDLIASAAVVQIDDEPAALGRYQPNAADVHADAEAAARRMIEMLDEAELPSPEGPWARSEPRAGDDAVSTAGAGVVDIRRALHALDAAVPAQRVLVTDGGRYVPESWTEVSAPDPRSFLFTVNFGSIGLGTAHAVGAAFARPDRPVLLVVGDGGFMHGGLAEFNTAVRHGVDLIVAVCDDGGYGAEHIQFRRRGADPALALFDWPDFPTVARALGGEGAAVTSERDLAGLAQLIAARTGPLLIDLRLDPDAVPSDRH